MTNSALIDIYLCGQSASSPPVMEIQHVVPVVDLDALQKRTNRTAAEISLLKLAIVVPMFAAGVVLALACVPQGLSNIRNVQIAEMEP